MAVTLSHVCKTSFRGIYQNVHIMPKKTQSVITLKIQMRSLRQDTIVAVFVPSIQPGLARQALETCLKPVTFCKQRGRLLHGHISCKLQTQRKAGVSQAPAELRCNFHGVQIRAHHILHYCSR